ncbi:MAG: electron transfer flavoprotein subunit alpha/FixB family protein [Treponema sp.]|nr:electron transfer flavoprotein subunit alpha/FixB family protein [Treponema sp.]
MKPRVWTLAEQHEGKLKAVSFELLSRGRSLADKRGGTLSSVLIGPALKDETLQELIRRGADEVIAVEDKSLAYFDSETWSGVLETLIRDYNPEIILAAATSTGRTLMPYTAVKVHAGLTADCTGLDIEEGTGNLLQTRPAIGGNIMATIKTPDHRPQMATVRPRSSRPPDEDPKREGRVIRFSLGATLPGGGRFPALKDGRTAVKGYRREETGFANLEEAELIISGGRGLKKGENFGLLSDLAQRLGGEVGASRDAVDRGWISYPHQVGLSGKTVSPRLYIGAGISGAIQHLAGIKTSEAIISINIDPDANLHKVADLAIVGDVFEVLGELRKRLGVKKGSGE